MNEATAAKQRATRTELAMVPLLKELGRPDLSERERAEKKQEIDRLRSQYKREMAPVVAFGKERQRVLDRVESVFARKDPEIERIRQELARILKRKDENEREEISRVKKEFDRRLLELSGNAE